MDAQEHLFYGFGHVAYALAMADGEVQREEHDTIHEIVENGIKEFTADYSVTDIIFQLLEKEHFDMKTAYKYGIENMRLGDFYLTKSIRSAFIDTLEKLAAAHTPTTDDERRLINDFKEDVFTMHIQ